MDIMRNWKLSLFLIKVNWIHVHNRIADIFTRQCKAQRNECNWILYDMDEECKAASPSYLNTSSFSSRRDVLVSWDPRRNEHLQCTRMILLFPSNTSTTLACWTTNVTHHVESSNILICFCFLMIETTWLATNQIKSLLLGKVAPQGSHVESPLFSLILHTG